MASSIMKSVLIFITMLLQLISCSSGLDPTKAAKVVEGGAKDIGNELGNIGKETPQTIPRVQVANVGEHDAEVANAMKLYPKIFGETLVKKYYGKQYIKGFRWGYKLEKRIHSVAEKCEDFTQALKDASCPQSNQPSPLPNSETVNCIVEAVALNGTCLNVYENEQYPPEAKCELDNPVTLNSNDCVPSGGFTIHLGWAWTYMCVSGGMLVLVL